MTTFKPPSKTAIFKMLKECGVSKTILKKILPAWWDDELLKTSTGLLQFSLLLRNRLGLNMDIAESGTVSFSVQASSLQFKKRASTAYSRLSDSTFLIQAAGKTIIKVLLYNNLIQNIEGLFSELYDQQKLDFEKTVQLLWKCNIPVLYVDNFTTSMTRPAGTIIFDSGMYAIILSHKHKSSSTQLFVLLHELGHLKLGHLKTSGLISDITVSALGESLKEETDQQEIDADNFAIDVLSNGVDIKGLIAKMESVERPAELALKAEKIRKLTKIHPGHFILTFGRETRNWPLAQQALKFIDRGDAPGIIKDVYVQVTRSYGFKKDDLELLNDMQRVK